MIYVFTHLRPVAFESFAHLSRIDFVLHRASGAERNETRDAPCSTAKGEHINNCYIVDPVDS